MVKADLTQLSAHAAGQSGIVGADLQMISAIVQLLTCKVVCTAQASDELLAKRVVFVVPPLAKSIVQVAVRCKIVEVIACDNPPVFSVPPKFNWLVAAMAFVAQGRGSLFHRRGVGVSVDTV